MQLRILLFSVAFYLLACNQAEESNPLLINAPYKVYTDSIKQFPSNADLYYKRGVLLYQNDQKKFAEVDLRKAWKLKPSEEYALSLTTLLREKNPDEAILFLQQAIDQFPNSIALHIGLARGYQQKGDLQKALAILDQMLAAIPNQLDALLLKASLLKDQNKTAEQIAVLEKAHHYAPSDHEITYQLAFAFAENKNDKVLNLTDSIIKAEGIHTKAEPYYFRGIYFANLANHTEAIRNFNDAIQHDFYFLNAYINKGIVYYDLKQYAEALKTFQLSVKISPSYDEGYYWIGKTQEAMGDRQNAKLNYQRAYGLNKENLEAKKAADKF